MFKSQVILKQLPIEKISRNPYQPRNEFNPQMLAELANSIKINGLVQPIIVRPIASDLYEIVAGERRWRAAQLAGLYEVTCIIRSYDDAQSAAIAIIENIQRIDLNPIEEAIGFQRLITEFFYTHEEIAIIIGKSRTKITNSLRLLKLDERIQTLLIHGSLSEGHGKIIAGLPLTLQYHFAQLALEKKWSVRKIEQEAQNYQTHELKAQIHTNSDAKQNKNLENLEMALSEHLGCKVKIEFNQNLKGCLKIDFHDLEILDGLLQKFGFTEETSDYCN